MEEKNKQLWYRIAVAVILLCSIGLTALSGLLLYNAGILRDHCVGDSCIPGYTTTWYSIFLAVIIVIASTYAFFMKRKWAKRIYLMLSVVGILACLCFCYAEYDLQKNWPQAEETAYFTSIDLNEVETVCAGKAEILYIGRDGCPKCEKVLPELEAYANEHQLSISYYNTIKDRENNAEQMNKVLDGIGVQSVPALLVVKDGKIERSLFDEGIVQDLKKYLETN